MRGVNGLTEWHTNVSGKSLDAIVEAAERAIADFFGVSNIDWYDLDIGPGLEITNASGEREYARYEASVYVTLGADVVAKARRNQALKPSPVINAPPDPRYPE